MQTSQPNSDILPQLIQWATARPEIRCMLLTSTRAIPDAPVDALSDYDVVLVVRDIDPFVTNRKWIDDFGEVLVVYWDPVYPNPVFGIEQCANVTQYAGGLKIDFTLWPVALFARMVAAPALPAELDAGYLVLLDKDRLAASMQPPTGKAYIPVPPTRETFERLINDFLSDAPYVAKCLWRDELLPARWCLDCDMRHTYLRPLLEWRVEIDHGWSVPVGWLGKGLKQRLLPDLWAQVEQTLAGARIDENWGALEHMLEVFRRVAVEVGAELGYGYPHELHARVAAYVQHVKQKPPPGDALRKDPQP